MVQQSFNDKLQNQSYQVDRSHGTDFQAFMAGACAGAVAKTIVAPLDRVKIIFQVGNKRFTFAGVYHKCLEIFRNEGVPGLFKGNTATLLRIVPFAGTQFLSHKKYKCWLSDSDGNLTNLKRLCAGSLSGITATLFTYPLDLMRARMAASQNSHLFKGIVEAYQSGSFSLYRGVTPTLVGIIPYAGLSFYTYETLTMFVSSLIKDNVLPKLDNRSSDVGVPYRLVCGGLAGMLGQTVSYPLDTLRRRMQTEDLNLKRKYSGILKSAQIVIREEGFRGLYKGLSLNWAKGPIASSISFTVFHSVSVWLRD